MSWLIPANKFAIGEKVQRLSDVFDPDSEMMYGKVVKAAWVLERSPDGSTALGRWEYEVEWDRSIDGKGSYRASGYLDHGLQHRSA